MTAVFSSSAPADEKPQPTPEPVVCRAVTVAGIEVICVATGIGSFTKQDRANSLEQHLRRLADDRNFDPAQIKFSQAGGITNFTADGTVLLSLGPADLADKSVKIGEQHAQSILQSMRASIAAEQLLKNPDTFLWGGLKTLTVSIALLFLIESCVARATLGESDGWYRAHRERMGKAASPFESRRILSFPQNSGRRTASFLRRGRRIFSRRSYSDRARDTSGSIPVRGDYAGRHRHGEKFRNQ